MKKFRKLIPALIALLISFTCSTSATFAWFSMNTQVQAANMQVKAVADQGILINEVSTYNDANWDDSANTATPTSISLHATSTANTGTWFVAYSKVASDSASATSSANSTNLIDNKYYTLGTTAGTDVIVTSTETVAAVAGSSAQQDITYHDFDGDTDYTNGEGYYVKYTYYIKSSATAITCALTDGAQNLNIVAPTVTGNSSSVDLDKSLRVAVVINGKAYIFAPLNSSAGTNYVGTSHTAITPLTGDQATSLTSIPASTDTNGGVEVNVFLYFEGEDANLKTESVTSTLDDLTVELAFKLVTNSGAATDNGVNVN